jgi:hypothetical protein
MTMADERWFDPMKMNTTIMSRIKIKSRTS